MANMTTSHKVKGSLRHRTNTRMREISFHSWVCSVTQARLRGNNIGLQWNQLNFLCFFETLAGDK